MTRDSAGMIERLDPFALMFDSLTPDPAVAARIPFERPEPQGAGFYLQDDAGGRFVIDRDTGVISLAHDALLAVEGGASHNARVLVIEPSGARYELGLRLKLTGHVPQVAGADDAFALAPMPAAPGPAPTLSFAQFSASRAAEAAIAPLEGETAPFGALVTPPAPLTLFDEAALNLAAAAPTPAPRGAAWSL